MARQLTIPYYRPLFVEKAIGDVGDGTLWPMLVTVDQLAEIHYRVRMARFSQGDAVSSGSGLQPVQAVNTGATPDPATIDLIMTTVRGSCFVYPDGFGLPAGGDDYFDPPEVFGLVAGWNYRVMKADELGIWYPVVSEVDHSNQFSAYMETFDLALTGFSTEGQVSSSDPAYADVLGNGIGTFVGEYVVALNKEVAFIDTDESGDPFSPANSIYLGVQFHVFNFYGGPTLFLNSVENGAGGLADTLSDLTFGLKLADGTVLTCPIYSNHTLTGTSFILEAIEWFPYDDGLGNPVWNTTTGARL